MVEKSLGIHRNRSFQICICSLWPCTSDGASVGLSLLILKMRRLDHLQFSKHTEPLLPTIISHRRPLQPLLLSLWVQMHHHSAAPARILGYLLLLLYSLGFVRNTSLHNSEPSDH